MKAKTPERIVNQAAPRILKAMCGQMSAPDYSSAYLRVWLSGQTSPIRGLPQQFEPYMIIYRTFEGRFGNPAYPQHSHRTLLAMRLGEFFDEEPDRQGESPRVLGNALCLANKLGYADELCEPLTRMVNRRSLHGEYLVKGLDIADLRSMLLWALVQNQKDSRFHPLWRTLLENKPPEFFAMGEDVSGRGFEGVLYMPESEETRGRPFLEAIGEAIVLVAHHIANRDDRDEIIKRIVVAPTEVYHFMGRFHYQRMAEVSQWPEWIVNALPYNLKPLSCKKQLPN